MVPAILTGWSFSFVSSRCSIVLGPERTGDVAVFIAAHPVNAILVLAKQRVLPFVLEQS